MKRQIFLLFLSIYSLDTIKAADEGKYLRYENLPDKIFFTSFLEGFYIKPATELGNQAALTYFLSSKVILDALLQGEGVTRGLSMISVSVPQAELKAFAKFAKNLASGQLTLIESYKDAFGTNDGIKILQDLQVDPQLLTQVKTALTLDEFTLLEESKKEKRKRESEEDIPSKRLATKLPKVIIAKDNGKDFELNEVQVQFLNSIENSTISNFISDTDESTVRVELPVQFNSLSNVVINDFLNMIIELYKNGQKPSDLEIWNKLMSSLFQNKITLPKDIILYIKTMLALADWFGYDNYSKKVNTLSTLLSVPVIMSQGGELKQDDQKIKDLATKFKIPWSAQDIAYVLEKIENVMKQNVKIAQNASRYNVLKSVLSNNKLITISDFGNLAILKNKIREILFISAALSYESLQNSLVSFDAILRLLEQLLALNSLPQATSTTEIAARLAKKRNLSLSLKEKILKFNDDLPEENRAQALYYLNQMLGSIPGVASVLESLNSVQ